MIIQYQTVNISEGGGTTAKRKGDTKNAKKKKQTNLRLNRPKVAWPKLVRPKPYRPNLTRWTPNIRRKANSKPKRTAVPSRRRHPVPK